MIRELTATIREFILGLDESIEEVPKKYYVAYKISQNIVCMEVKGRNIKLFLKLKPSDIPADTGHYRDVTSIGHYGTGDVVFTLASEAVVGCSKSQAIGFSLFSWHHQSAV